MLDPRRPLRRRVSDTVKGKLIEAAKTVLIALIAALAAYFTARTGR